MIKYQYQEILDKKGLEGTEWLKKEIGLNKR